jgi:hypothetical protein
VRPLSGRDSPAECLRGKRKWRPKERGQVRLEGHADAREEKMSEQASHIQKKGGPVRCYRGIKSESKGMRLQSDANERKARQFQWEARARRASQIVLMVGRVNVRTGGPIIIDTRWRSFICGKARLKIRICLRDASMAPPRVKGRSGLQNPDSGERRGFTLVSTDFFKTLFRCWLYFVHCSKGNERFLD